MMEFYHSPIMEPVRLFVGRVIDFLPNVLLALAVVLFGVISAWLVRFFLRRFLKLASFDRMCDRLGFGEVLGKGGIQQPPSELVASIICWLLVLVFLFMALSALHLDATNELISRFFGYLPHLLVASGLLALSYLLSRFLLRSVLIASVNANVRHAGVLARGVQAMVLVFGAAAALEQLAIGKGVVLAAFSITFGGVVLALALAFGLAGRDLARDFLNRVLRPSGSPDQPRDEIRHL